MHADYGHPDDKSSGHGAVAGSETGAFRLPCRHRIYLLHMPIAQCLAALDPWPAGAPQSRMLVVGGTLLGVMLLARWTEGSKDAWRRWFASGLSWLAPVRAAP